MNTESYTYFIHCSPEDEKYVARCIELPSLSWLAKSPVEALTGLVDLIAEMNIKPGMR